MTTFNTLLLDQSAWDLVLDANGNIAMAAPPYAIAQDVASAVRTFLGEVYYDQTLGIWSTSATGKTLGKLPPAALLIELINQESLKVPGVVTVQTFITSFSGRAVTGNIQFVDENNVTHTVNF